MQAIVLDEINQPDLEKVREHCRCNLVPSRLDEVFWLELPPELLSPEQAGHAECAPHRVAVVVEEGAVKLELLVRSQTSLRCACTAYATPAQREFLWDFAQSLVADLGIRT